MKTLAIGALGLSVLLFSSVRAEEKAKFDATKLEGKWTITSGQRDGAAIEESHLKGTVTITKDAIMIVNDMTHKMSYKVDAKETPIAIDMEGLEGPAKGFKAAGIIELKGDELKLAYASMGGDRPKEFVAKKDSSVLYFVLKRAKGK